MAAQDDDVRLERYLRWIDEQDVRHPKIQWPADFGHVRGCLVLEDIDEKEAFISVPSALLITPEKASCAPIAAIINDHPELLTNRKKDDVLLILFLLHEFLLEEQSFWWPYLQMLEYAESLCDWSEEELLQLQNISLQQKAADRKIERSALYCDLLRALTQHPDVLAADRCSQLLFDIAASTVQTRAFGDQAFSTAIIPFADNVNHGLVDTTFRVTKSGRFELRTVGQSYHAGQEALFSYGPRNTEFLLLEYGFSLPENGHDAFVLTVDYTHSDQAVLERKREQLWMNNMDTHMEYLLRRHKLRQDVIAFYRVCAHETMDVIDCWKPLSIANEAAAIDAFRRDLSSAVQSFPTTLKEDESILADATISVRLRFALQYRIGLKRILSDHLRLCDFVCELLLLTGEPLIQRLLTEISVARLPGSCMVGAGIERESWIEYLQSLLQCTKYQTTLKIFADQKKIKKEIQQEKKLISRKGGQSNRR
eukprot:GILJ01008426.1.p1 GENE.GILJ01008426.1~~GILJ01008426.1.p1  ORF type:complete len:481 (+),score=59.76 GILJ01008426.1:36-1478(+)